MIISDCRDIQLRKVTILDITPTAHAATGSAQWVKNVVLKYIAKFTVKHRLRTSVLESLFYETLSLKRDSSIGILLWMLRNFSEHLRWIFLEFIRMLFCCIINQHLIAHNVSLSHVSVYAFQCWDKLWKVSNYIFTTYVKECSRKFCKIHRKTPELKFLF